MVRARGVDILVGSALCGATLRFALKAALILAAAGTCMCTPEDPAPPVASPSTPGASRQNDTTSGQSSSAGATSASTSALADASVPAPRSGAGVDRVLIARGDHRIGGSGIQTPFQGIPRRIVALGPFAMDRSEVTAAAYRACVDSGACSAPQWSVAGCNFDATGRAAHPINCVSREQAEAFCAWRGGRLPSEEEWEAAARWAASREAILDIEGCLHGHMAADAGTCPVDRTASVQLPGWSDNVAEWVTGSFCAAAQAFCSEGIVKGRSFRGTVSLGAYERFLPPGRGDHSGRRAPEEIGFRCARTGHDPIE